MIRFRKSFIAMAMACGFTCGAPMVLAQTAPLRSPDVIFVPTPSATVERMLQMAKVTKSDVLYDLGCGDGRIVIEAAKRYGVRAVGIDIDPQRIAEANANAKAAGVSHLVQFRNADLFESNISEATVVTLYLLPRLNVKLRPKLEKELKKGTRVVSHDFETEGWKPTATSTVDGRTVYLWVI